MRRVVYVFVFAMLAGLLAPAALAQDSGDQVVLRIGLTQDWDTLNATVGFSVPSYEIWNLHYATLTDKAADDFAVEPGLAESWVASDDGLTYTYTLRDGLKWSDGEPLTADDVAWTINTARDQEWDDMIATVANLDATAVDDHTVKITSSVPDPKLPVMDIYILPKHIWEPIATDYDAAVQYDASDNVGSGPFVVSNFTKGQSVTLVANPNFWGWDGNKPPIDKIVFQLFENPDAMVAALQQGQLDAAHGIPAGSVDSLKSDPNIEVVAGQQGGFDEIALNGGAAESQPHPALLDLNVRKAIAYAIDRDAVIEDLWFNLATPLEVVSASADPKWLPDLPVDDQFTYDPDKANQILDDAGYLDTDGDGIREMPDGTNPIVLRHAVNTDGDLAPQIGDMFKGWMAAIGIGVDLQSYDQDALYGVIADGDYDSFFWGWVPFVDPDPMLSYFTSDQVGNWNDANWADPTYDQMYVEQNQELDPDKRLDIVHQMLTYFHDAAVYFPLYLGPDIQAYRTDTFEGWVRQPKDIGPVMFSNSSPSYVLLTPVGGSSGGSSGNTWLIVGIVLVVLIAGGVVLMMRRRATADQRE